MADHDEEIAALRARVRDADPQLEAALPHAIWHPRLHRAIVFTVEEPRRWASLHRDGELWLGIELDGVVRTATVGPDGRLESRGAAPAELAQAVLEADARLN